MTLRMTATEVALWISGGSLLVSVLAWWRSGRVRVLDLRTSVRKDVAELRVTLDDLAQTIPVAIQSRANVSAPIGHSGGPLQQFREGAKADASLIEDLRSRLAAAERVRLLASYSEVEAKAVALRTVRAHIELLQAKYLAAAAADEKVREHLRAAVRDRANRDESWGK
jgi:hypothetical protein